MGTGRGRGGQGLCSAKAASGAYRISQNYLHEGREAGAFIHISSPLLVGLASESITALLCGLSCQGHRPRELPLQLQARTGCPGSHSCSDIGDVG